MMTLWDKLMMAACGRPITLKIFEDNQAAMLICESGFSTKLCHISRTHGVNITSIKDEIDKPEISLLKIDTKLQAADVFTKGVEPQKWDAALSMLGIRKQPLPRKGADSPTEPAGLVTNVLVSLTGQDGAPEPEMASDDYTAIADTGAGATVGSMAAFVKQGAAASQIEKRLVPMAKPRTFVSANGPVIAKNTIEVKTQGIGSTSMHLLDTACPLAVSIGEEVNKGYAFVWSRKSPPFFARENHLRISCPKTKRHEAAFVRHNVPHFKIGICESPVGNLPLHSPSGSACGGSHF